NHYYGDDDESEAGVAPPSGDSAVSPTEPDASPNVDAGATSDAGSTEPGPPLESDAASAPEGDAASGDAASGDAATGPVPFEEGAPVVNATPAELSLDVFGTFDNSYWFVVSAEEVERMNERYGGGGGGFP